MAANQTLIKRRHGQTYSWAGPVVEHGGSNYAVVGKVAGGDAPLYYVFRVGSSKPSHGSTLLSESEIQGVQALFVLVVDDSFTWVQGFSSDVE